MLRPPGHAADRSKQAAQQHEQHDEKEGGKHGLLLRRRNGGDEQSESRKSNQIDRCKEIDHSQIAGRQQSVDGPGHHRPDRQQDKADDPERNQLGEQEECLRHRRHVDLLDRAFLLFANDVEGGKETGNDGKQEGHDAGHHIVFVVQMGIEQIGGSYSACAGCRGGIALLAVEIEDDGREVRAPDPSFRAVHGIGGYEYFRLPFPAQVFLEAGRDFEQNIRRVAFDGGQRAAVGWRDIGQPEIAGREDLVGELPGDDRAVVVYDPQIDVPYLEVGGKREDDQLHQRNQEDEAGQKTVAPDLFEFFLQ